MSLLKKLFGNKSDISGSSTEAEGILGAVSKIFDKNEKEIAKLQPLVKQIGEIGTELKDLSDEEIKARSAALKARFKEEVSSRLSKNGLEWLELSSQLSWTSSYISARFDAEKEVLNLILPEAFALCRESGDRTIGLRHFDVQLIGGAVLHGGKIAEMRTGEGKTLVATLPAYLNALTGRGVHCVTVNDYLAERDANWMRPVYEFLGLSVAFLQNDMDSAQRQVAYASDILYGTNSEFGFDYLRDNMARSPEDMSQRPLNFAIIDEVDNILIDEARTPLIISAQVAKTDRALRRQTMSKTCDGVANVLVPAVTDREVEAFIDEHTSKNKVDIAGLGEAILARGAFRQATNYLISAYLQSEASARNTNAARLLDAAQELFDDKLTGENGRASLEKLALSACQPALLHEKWREDVQALVQPFEFAVLNAKDAEFNAELLAHDLGLGAEAAGDLEAELGESDDKLAFTLDFAAAEMARRGLIEASAKSAVAAALDNSHDALVDAVLRGPGNLADADKILMDNVPAEDIKDVAGVRAIVAALETLTQNAMLPFDSLEKLWQTVEIARSRDQLRAELLKSINSDTGSAASEVKKLTADYSTKRAQFLKEQANILSANLSATPNVAKLAEKGENATTIAAALQRELGKSGPFSQAVKAAQALQKEQDKIYKAIAANMSEEMATFLEEMPPDAQPILVSLLAAGGKQNEVSERLIGAVRDLPGDSQELSSIAGDAAIQLQTWRQENSVAFVGKVDGLVALREESKTAIQNAIEDGEFPEKGLDEFVGAQLLTADSIAPQSKAVETYGVNWDEFKAQSNAKLIADISGQIELANDAREALSDLLAQPSSGALDAQILEALAADAVARHLEPLLTEENARAFTDEVKRRILVDKDIEKNVRVKPSDFVGRSADQLSRALSRLVPRSLEVLEFDKYKRVVKNLGWLTEKDEKRRTAALTDMGTLVADREAAKPVFADPENFLETLLQGDILTEDEILVIQGAAEEGELVSSTVDRVLRLPADRRRRLSEAKLQEVQSVLDQSIKAHALFEYNVNYVIGREESGKQGIVIVDEFTGRTMPGRRFSEGLHEALEAKHGLDVAIESQTVATITIQNYFRLYNKISGLTGTAKTEETEFAKTYGMEVVTVPTNKQIRRKDAPDVVYKTAEAKFRAITFDVLEHHVAGQPVLTGTRSVEVSEQMGRRLSANALQNLVLARLITDKLLTSKDFPDADKAGMLAFVRQPILGLNPMQVKALAKNVGLNPDAASEDNLSAILSKFEVGTPDRNLLAAALKQGLPHNVLNAKNHRNEARIIAEAARPGAVTIATNMAGRGVDIILGGSLDGESRWRVITEQLLARAVEGKSVHVRSRNVEATQLMLSRLNPEALQTLAWATANLRALEELERTKQLEGQAAKELKDALGTDLTSPDFANRVRSRARRFNLLDKLPVDTSPLETPVVSALSADLARLMGREYDSKSVAQFLENGLAAQEHAAPNANLGRSGEELALLYALARPLAFSQDATENLLTILSEIPDLDAQLLELVAAGTNLQPDVLAANLGVVTSDWVVARLNELGVPNSSAARERLSELDSASKEVSEFQIATLMGENFPGTPWLRARLSEWEAVDNARPFEGTPEMQQALQDGASVHLTLNPKIIAKKRAAWSLPDRRRDMVGFELPNLAILQELSQLVGQAPFLEPQWLHDTIVNLGLSGENDVFQANMMAQVQDENGVESVQPIDVLVYHYTLSRLLEAVKPTVRAAAKDVGDDADTLFQALSQVVPWLSHFADAQWIAKTLAEAPAELEAAPEDSQNALANPQTPVVIETGVSGQSADVVLESEARPEDIAHTSDRDEVTGNGGLHIIGTERHESRRIDNQLRGRAGRQGDPGTSRFYISLDDELWRLFGTRGQALLGGWEEEEAVENKIITKSIERAQKKVELNHFESRKQVLQYDDVMNMQREVIYRERRRALAGEDIRDTVSDMAHKAALAEAEKHCPRNVRAEEWDTHKLFHGLGRTFGSLNLRHHLKEDDLEDARWVEKPGSDITNAEFDFVLKSGESFADLTEKLYEERENQIGTDQTRGLERWQVMKSIDSHWMEHLAEMDYLRDAIWQQGYAQKEPIGVYRQEGFSLFQKMLGEIRREVTESIFGYDTPDFENEDPTLEFGELEEGRMLEMPFGDDGLDDGVQLDKDGDGHDDGLIKVHPQSGIEPEPNRASRRANKRN